MEIVSFSAEESAVRLESSCPSMLKAYPIEITSDVVFEVKVVANNLIHGVSHIFRISGIDLLNRAYGCLAIAQLKWGSINLAQNDYVGAFTGITKTPEVDVVAAQVVNRGAFPIGISGP